MRPLPNLLKQVGLFLVLLTVMILTVGGLVYLASWLSANRNAVRVFDTPTSVATIPLLHTPEAPFAPLNPAIMAYLEYRQAEYGAIPLNVVGGNRPPIGAYLPRTGNTQYELPQPTALPTLFAHPTLPTLPYPTSPPIPATLPPPTAVPSPTPDLVATVLAFDAAVQPQPFFYLGFCAPSGRPVEGFLTQYFTGYHSGLDIAIPLETPVLATHSGIVTWADWNVYGYGNLVIIQSDRYITYYAHLNSPNVLPGQQVQKGSLIAFSGNTGRSSGPHIHYETRIDDVPVDPLTFEARGFGTC